MDNLLFNVYSLVSIIPTIVGIFYLKKIDKTIKPLILLNFIGNILMLISIVLSYSKSTNTHFILYLNISFSIILNALFFYRIIKKHKLLFSLIPSVSILLLFIDYYKNGLRQMNVLPFICIDIFIICSSIFFLSYNKKPAKYLRYIVLVLLVYSVYDVLFNFATSYFYNYLGDKAFNLVWNIINPIVGIIDYIFLSFAFYFAVQKARPNFDELSDFK